MCGGSTVIALVFIDSHYYGKTVLAPLNIVLYNVFSSHGPNLYDFSYAYWQRFLPVLFVFMSMCLWLVIFFSQPHKEERFLFPIYPLIALLAAVTLDAIPRVGTSLLGGGTRKVWHFCVGAYLVVFVVLSLSRSAALHRNFSAPIEVFKGLNEHLTVPANLDKQRYQAREVRWMS
ncbi:unnamed protein product [Anisakis simplex]|uniref:Mannosyltransferase n=1 Tax=Anisakis simplex TaxID=6269 RepID=A0A0M3KHW4_ANISI|nr:unnamed protein product [Anisakis simplex]